jgi:hypothetical protein
MITPEATHIRQPLFVESATLLMLDSMMVGSFP